MKLCNTLTPPYISNCIVIWCSTCKSYFRDLIIFSKKALKLALGVPKLTPSGVVFKQSKALQLRDINNVQIDVFIYKYSICLLPVSYDFKFVVNKEFH